jgi:hypothetical protein
MFFFLGACKKADVDITESLGNDNGLAEQSLNE